MSEEETPGDFYSAYVPEPVAGASDYNFCEDIGIITCYFNSPQYHTKLRNFLNFQKVFRKSGINLITVECAFGDSPFVLDQMPSLLRIRSEHVLWQKERLINVALGHLPKHVKKVAWLDCDILFSNPNWLIETSELLDNYPIVQPFQTAIRLPRGLERYEGSGEVWNSFGYEVTQNKEVVSKGDFHRHGHTGFAWAAGRDLLERHGLYDACISGSGDHFMAHAMCGDFSSACFDRLPMSVHQSAHFQKWGRSFYSDVQAKIGFLPGVVLHLWHGDSENRKYVKRHSELVQHEFNPTTDLEVGTEGAWHWKSNKPRLRQWAIDYFYERKEDGEN